MKILSVRVKPNAHQQMIHLAENGSLSVQLRSSPMDGKANQELIQLLAKEFGVQKSAVRIKSRITSKNKLIAIDL